MFRKYHSLFLLVTLIACTPQTSEEIDEKIMASLGEKYKREFSEMAEAFNTQTKEDTTHVAAYVGYAESQILLYVFGYVPRTESVEKARSAFEQARNIDPQNADVLRLSGIIHFLDWNWEEAEINFRQAIKQNPQDLSARHWYSLWLSAMGDFESAMAQSDTIMTMDTEDQFLVGRSSLLYFQYRFEEMKPLMLKNIEQNPEVPWGYDWLGMAYNGLGEHHDALETYFKAFELSDGTVEVGAGLGHALGQAGETKKAKQMADYYEEAARDHYLPPVQRSFIHLGIGEHNKALDLLEQAYNEHSWFLIFMQIEHWYDPIREEQRFIDMMQRMNFPK
ncbi:MAG: hypothetical protein R2804_12935 [Cyclobacteriaceae bacterium]